MSDPVNPSSIPPKDIEAYQKEYAQSVKLFDQALQGYHSSTQDAQKNKFKDVMEQALPIINELVNCGLKSGGKANDAKLETDYQNYMKSGSEEDFKKVSEDINSLKP